MKEVVIILLIILKVHLIIRFVPLRYYFKAYFLESTPHIPDKQLFHKYLRLYKRVLRHLPFKLICLAESMVLYDLLKIHGMVNPIHLGLRMESDLKAHAWNDHQQVSDFKIII